MRNVVQLYLVLSIWLQILFCSCVNETTLFLFLPSLLRENGRSLRFPKIFLKKLTWSSNDKAIIELGYRKISRFVSVSQINYLPQPSASANNWSSRHWQITIAQPRPIIANYSHFIYNQTGPYACVPVDNRGSICLVPVRRFPSPSRYFGDVTEEDHVTPNALVARNNEA